MVVKKNIDEYNKIYQRAFNDRYEENKKFQEKIQMKFTMVIMFFKVGLKKKIHIILKN